MAQPVTGRIARRTGSTATIGSALLPARAFVGRAVQTRQAAQSIAAAFSGRDGAAGGAQCVPAAMPGVSACGLAMAGQDVPIPSTSAAEHKASQTLRHSIHKQTRSRFITAPV